SGGAAPPVAPRSTTPPASPATSASLPIAPPDTARFLSQGDELTALAPVEGVAANPVAVVTTARQVGSDQRFLGDPTDASSQSRLQHRRDRALRQSAVHVDASKEPLAGVLDEAG